jgi:hypothetical protein
MHKDCGEKSDGEELQYTRNKVKMKMTLNGSNVGQENLSTNPASFSANSEDRCEESDEYTDDLKKRPRFRFGSIYGGKRR